MKRPAVPILLVAALALAGAASPAPAQATFKVPFGFETGGKKLPAGTYVVSQASANQLTLVQVPSGKETSVPVVRRLSPAEPPATEPRLVFDEVGNFEPSYTEYFTVYVLAEVWLSSQDGCLIHTTKGAHKVRTVTAEPAKK